MTEVYYIEHFWHGKITTTSFVDVVALLFFSIWISLNCIVIWIHIWEPGPTGTTCLSQSIRLKKCRTKDGQCWDWNIKKCCILCKNCMHVIYCVWWASPVLGAVLSVVPLQMSTVCEVWICGRLADSPSPASSQPACQQHLLLLRA